MTGDGVNQPAAKKPEAQKKPDFEKSLARLEEVVRKLESPQLSLDEAPEAYKHFDDRDEGWTKVLLKPGASKTADKKQHAAKAGAHGAKRAHAKSAHASDD